MCIRSKNKSYQLLINKELENKIKMNFYTIKIIKLNFDYVALY